jgi:FkbM family methyltransferase
MPQMSDKSTKEGTHPVTPDRGQAFYKPHLSLKHRAFIGLLKLFERAVRLISDDLYFKTMASLLTEINCVMEFPTRAGPILMHSQSETARLRAKQAPTQEVDTLQWIDGFNSDDVLWDIGSNVGVFSLYAAKVAGVRVLAFELLPWNFSTLIENLRLNDLHDRVSAFCLGITDRIAPISVNVPLPADTLGGAGGQINSDYDGFGHPMKTLYLMGGLGFTVDGFVQIDGVLFPNHIKIDIDGNEDKLLAGAKKTLTDPRIKSLMFELQPLNSEQIKKEIEALGFDLVSVSFPNHLFVPRAGRSGR